MTRIKTDSRARLLQAAETLTYHRGFASTAIADIAQEAKVPLGNVYYYFKTKEEIGGAIVERRLSRFRKLLEDFDRAAAPQERICAFVDTKIPNREALARSGCPVGTVCSELHKQGGAVAKKSTELLAEALAWMEAQFKALGKETDSRGLAVHLLSATQGISVLAHTFHDPEMIETE